VSQRISIEEGETVVLKNTWGEVMNLIDPANATEGARNGKLETAWTTDITSKKKGNARIWGDPSHQLRGGPTPAVGK